jgi:heme/copper-type cytochrome/quinol oxidase subunit 2
VSPTAGGLILLILAIACYFLPSIIALIRGKANGQMGVIFVNLFLGWTVVGWFLAFVWACSGETQAQIDKRDRQHRELLEVIAVKK